VGADLCEEDQIVKKIKIIDKTKTTTRARDQGPRPRPSKTKNDIKSPTLPPSPIPSCSLSLSPPSLYRDERRMEDSNPVAKKEQRQSIWKRSFTLLYCIILHPAFVLNYCCVFQSLSKAIGLDKEEDVVQVI
jgi:hypothetical protein